MMGGGMRGPLKSGDVLLPDLSGTFFVFPL